MKLPDGYHILEDHGHYLLVGIDSKHIGSDADSLIRFNHQTYERGLACATPRKYAERDHICYREYKLVKSPPIKRYECIQRGAHLIGLNASGNQFIRADDRLTAEELSKITKFKYCPDCGQQNEG